MPGDALSEVGIDWGKNDNAMASSRLPESRDLLLLEYERSSEFTNHVDDVRNIVTSFFLTIVAGAAVALNKYSDGTLRDGKLGSAALLAVVVTFSATTIGSLFVLTLARLRRVQFQRYFIMNRILDACMPLQERILIAFRSKD